MSDDQEYEEYEDDYRDPDTTSEPAPEPEAPAKRTRKAPSKAEVPAPIMEAKVPTSLQGIVKFTRSVNLGTRDNNAHFSVELAFTYQPGMSLEEVAALAADTFFTAKTLVFQEANLPFTIDDGGVIHEVLRDATPVEDEKPRKSRRRQDDDDEDQDERPRRSRRRDDDDDDEDRPRGRRSKGLGLEDMDRPKHIKPATWNDLLDNPEDWWDNRPKKKSGEYSTKSPDFKHRETEEAVWLRPPRQGGR